MKVIRVAGQVDFPVYLAALFPEVDGSSAHGTSDAGVGVRDADSYGYWSFSMECLNSEKEHFLTFFKHLRPTSYINDFELIFNLFIKFEDSYWAALH